ncbi:MAG: sulfite exporter TauE/SafE family protein [Byssovorax sp.]
MILETAALTALATGVLGSAHCAAMCGPLAVAGCSAGDTLSPRRVAGYFVGRAVAYTTVGAVLGHLGRHALCVLPMAALEGVAVALVAGAAAYRGITLLRRKARTPALVQLHGQRRGASGARATTIVGLVAQLLPRRGLGLGLATGVLPCGLLLPAWALAAGTASAPAGAAVMALFSLATLPGLLVPLAGRRLLQRMTARLPASTYGVAWCALSLWILARPLLRATGHCH